MGGIQASHFLERMVTMYAKWATNPSQLRNPTGDSGGGGGAAPSVDIVSRAAGVDGKGLRAATVRVRGLRALRGGEAFRGAEEGTHRLVEQHNGKRHTAFVNVVVFPVEKGAGAGTDGGSFDAKDVSFDTFRASGAGGQHVNTTDSAVRATHTCPQTGQRTVAACQGSRSQHANKASALAMLGAKLEHATREQAHATRAAHRADVAVSAGRGTEFGGGMAVVRNYVMDGGSVRVADPRTRAQHGDPDTVLDRGDLAEFLEAAAGAGGDTAAR